MLFVDIQFPFFEISSLHNERLSHGNINGINQNLTYLNVDLHVSDLLLLLLTILVIIKIFPNLRSFYLAYKKEILFYLSFVGFFIYQILLILFNSNKFAETQVIIQYLYLLRFFEISFFPILVLIIFYLTKNKATLLKRTKATIIFGGFITSSAALIFSANQFFSRYIVDNRLEFYGPIIFSASLIIVYLQNQKEIKLSTKTLAYSLILALYYIAIISSKKRSLELAFLILQIEFCIIMLFKYLPIMKRNFLILLSPYNFALNITLSLITFYLIYSSVFNNSIHLENPAYYYGPGNVYFDILKDAKLPINYIDPSSAERIAKIIRTNQNIFENWLFGIGFWGSTFKYDYLPDFIGQFFLESGAIGVFLYIYPFYVYFKKIKLSIKNLLLKSTNRVFLKSIGLVCIVFFFLSAVFNFIYSFKIMYFFNLLIVLAFIEYSSHKKNIRWI